MGVQMTGGADWNGAMTAGPVSFVCGYCGHAVATRIGWEASSIAQIRICPGCCGPTFFDPDARQWPGPLPGAKLEGLPEEVQALLDEVKYSMAGNAFTGAVLLARKILMHVAVEKGASKDQNFAKYVEWLVSEHYVPKGSEVWLDYIRKRGNEANHEVKMMTKDDATGLLRFTEGLLRNVYELPGAVPASE